MSKPWKPGVGSLIAVFLAAVLLAEFSARHVEGRLNTAVQPPSVSVDSSMEQWVEQMRSTIRSYTDNNHEHPGEPPGGNLAKQITTELKNGIALVEANDPQGKVNVDQARTRATSELRSLNVALEAYLAAIPRSHAAAATMYDLDVILHVGKTTGTGLTWIAIRVNDSAGREVTRCTRDAGNDSADAGLDVPFHLELPVRGLDAPLLMNVQDANNSTAARAVSIVLTPDQVKEIDAGGQISLVLDDGQLGQLPYRWRAWFRRR